MWVVLRIGCSYTCPHTQPPECLDGTPVPESLPPCRPFRQRQGAANVQWLASPTVVPELGGYSRLLNLGHSGLPATSSTLGEGLLGRASQTAQHIWDVSSFGP